MKRVKRFSLITVFVMLFSIFTNNVYAASATVGFSGDSTVAVGDNITVKMYVSNVTDAVGGVVSVGGNLSFDSEYLEYVSSTGASTPYLFQINTGANYKIAGLDTTLSNGINSQTTVFTFVFKAKKAGTTSVTLTNAKLSDTASKMTATVNAKTITIVEAGSTKSNDATLKSLGVDGYTLSPTFNKNTTSYSINVPSGTIKVNLTGAVNDSKATVTGLGNVTLTGDTTTANVKVTAEDGTTKTYTVKINRESVVEPPKSNDATLGGLTVDGFTLSPAFNKDITSYEITVPNGTTSVNLGGTSSDSNATVTGLGNIPLTGDTTTVNVKVKAEDGTVKTYTIKINKETSGSTEAKDSDATLKSLNVSGYSLLPAFDKDIKNYSMTVANNITSLKVDATANSEKATVTITGNSGWKVGVNTIVVKVKAEDGTTNAYVVNVTRESAGADIPVNKLSSDNYLSNLVINSTHEMNTKFNSNTSNYNITVPNEVTSLDLKTVLSDSKSKVTVTGNSNFEVGKTNVVEVKITAEDGSIRIYTLNVTRLGAKSANDLDNVIINGATLKPQFSPDVLEYDITIGPDQDKLDITAIPSDSGSKVEIIGNSNLKEGNNTVLVKVTDKNGFSKYYQINVTKEAKNNAVIGGLTTTQFGITLTIILLALLILIGLLIALLRKKETKTTMPTIEVKPEFNFGSKNVSDDDVVHGNFNQASEIENKGSSHDNVETLPYTDAEFKEIPYDPYDDIVTKEELIRAIREKDPEKLKMLLDQEKLNRIKDEMKSREENDVWR